MGQVITVTPNYKPHPKQLMLHNAPVSYEDLWIILYGGARGSGKSAGALADAFMFCQTYPGAKVVIIRENLDAVKQSFLDKLPSLFPQLAQGVKLYEYREKSSSWYPSRSIVFPNGSYITLQRVANYNEAKEKQGGGKNIG
jgi:phage terminase large subunit